MGKTLREISTQGIVDDLIKAHADEWLAYYLYNFLAQSVSGPLYPQLKKMLEDIAKSEYEHANELADMIVKLGGKLIADPNELEKNANFPVIIPSGKLDLSSICSIVAESESTAIKTYNDLALKTKDSDIAVYNLISHILSEEIDHEEMFENLTK